MRASCIAAAAAPLLAWLAFAAPAGAANGHPEAVLAEAEELLVAPAEAGATSGELTLVLAELAAVSPQLEGEDRRAAHAILARPDDGNGDPYGDGFTVDEAAESPECSANFCVHWVSTSKDAPSNQDSNGIDDGDGVPDFVEETLASADQSFDTENTSLGWTEPKSDAARGGGAGLTDVYLIDTDGAYFGYASPDDGQGTAVSKHGYLVLDEDNVEFDGVAPLDAMRVTMAHEYAHVLQFTYDSRVSGRDQWVLEATATWMEEQVYPAIDDYLRYVPAYAESTALPLTANSGVRIYGAALWNHFLSASEGPQIIREAWEDIDAVTPAHLAAAAYDSALGGDGASPFEALSEQYLDFAGVSAEWRARPDLFADAALLPDATRYGRMVPGKRAQRFPLDHLAHGLLKVPAATAEAGLTLKLRCPAAVHCGAALVTRDGSATGGVVDVESAGASGGGPVSVTIPGGSHSRVTAVVVNADADVNASGRYTSDDSRFRVKLAAG